MIEQNKNILKGKTNDDNICQSAKQSIVLLTYMFIYVNTKNMSKGRKSQ